MLLSSRLGDRRILTRAGKPRLQALKPDVRQRREYKGTCREVEQGLEVKFKGCLPCANHGHRSSESTSFHFMSIELRMAGCSLG